MIGTLALYAPEEDAFDAEEMPLLVDLADNLAYGIGVLRTQQKLKQDEAVLLQARKIEAMGLLASGVAHDFNNLLTIINGYADLLLKQVPLEDGPRAQLTEILCAGRRAAALTGQLLAFSREQPLEPEILDLNEVLEGLAAMLRRLIGGNIDLVLQPGKTPQMVRADRGQLEQVLMNLAVNSRDAMPLGGQLFITAAPDETSAPVAADTGKLVGLTVADTGCGMDAKTRARIFEPFFTTKPVGQGTGLGLSMVHDFVKQSGGDIAVASEPGRGTTMTIRLPRVESAKTKAAGK